MHYSVLNRMAWKIVVLVVAIAVISPVQAVRTCNGFERPDLTQADVDRAINQLYEAISASTTYANENGWKTEHDMARKARQAIRDAFIQLGALDEYEFSADMPLREADVRGVPAFAGADGINIYWGVPPFHGWLNMYGSAICKPLDIVLAYAHSELVKLVLDDLEGYVAWRSDIGGDALWSGSCEPKSFSTLPSISAGADATWAPCYTHDWYTPSECVALLINKYSHKSLLHQVAELGRNDLVPVFLNHCPHDKRFDPNVPDESGNGSGSPLNYAVTNNHGAVVRALLEDHRIDPNISDICGYTPLANALTYDHEDATAALIEDPRVDVAMALQQINGYSSPLVERVRSQFREHQNAEMNSRGKRRYDDEVEAGGNKRRHIE